MKNKFLIFALFILVLGAVAWGVSRNQKTTNNAVIPVATEENKPQNTITNNETPTQVNLDTAEWKTYQNKEVGISFKYPDIFKRTDIKIIKGDTGRMFNGVLEFAPNHWISFGGVTEDFSQAKGGSILDTLGYEKDGSKYFLKFIWGKNEIVPSEFWKINGGKNEAIVIRDTGIEQILSSKDTAIFVNIPQSSFHGIVFSITPQNSGESVSAEEVEILHKIVSSIIFE